MIEIVKFDRPLIGYRLNNAVVYASVPYDLTDEEAKQYGYEQVKSALEYEQTQDIPSIDGGEMEAIEVFVPEAPKVVSINIIGDKFVSFEDESANKITTYTAVAYDQYGEIYQEKFVSETIDNDNYTHVVNVKIEGVIGSLDVQVYKYVEPAPQPPTIEEQLAEKDAQILELKAKQIATNKLVAESNAAQQDLLELLIDMGVI